MIPDVSVVQPLVPDADDEYRLQVSDSDVEQKQRPAETASGLGFQCSDGGVFVQMPDADLNQFMCTDTLTQVMEPGTFYSCSFDDVDNNQMGWAQYNPPVADGSDQSDGTFNCALHERDIDKKYQHDTDLASSEVLPGKIDFRWWTNPTRTDTWICPD